MRFSLLFPVLMSVGFAGLFLYSANRSNLTRQELFDIRDDLGLRTAPEYMVLKMFLWVSAVLMLAVATSLVVIVIFVHLPMPVK